MHPDQRTPDTHRYQSSDSQGDTDEAPSGEAPEQDQPDLETDPSAAEAMPDGDRIAEAGNAYIGRQLDDDLKTNPRLEDGDAATA